MFSKKKLLNVSGLLHFIALFFSFVIYAEPAESLPQEDPLFFAEGSRFWSLTAGRSDDDKLGNITLAQFNVSSYISDNLAVTYGSVFGYADTKRTKNGFLGGPEVGFRKHFINVRYMSMYIEGSVGAILHQHPLAPGTIRFNFDIQGGLGATYRINERDALRGGLRWQHLSNARVAGKSRNFGYDGPMVYAGLMRLF